MNETIKAHVDQVLDDIRGIYMRVVERIEALGPGERLPATSLAEDLARGLGMTGPQLYPIVKRLLDGYPGTTLKRGAHGGIRKNAPPRVGCPFPARTPCTCAEASRMSPPERPMPPSRSAC
jgi:hypothetical protein